MTNNSAFIITVLIRGIISLGFVAMGIYALMQGFIKSGGWLIAAGIISLCCTNISFGDKDKKVEP